VLSGPPRSRSAGAAFLAYGLLTAWLFAPVLFQGATLFFRDITYIYYPNYVFLESALRQGVWPLWNPSADAGAPFVAPVAAWYVPDVALAWLAGARGVLAIGPPLHVWLAMAGAFGLARQRGASGLGAFTAGAVFGLSGFVLSCVNLIPILQGAAWAPLAVLALLRLVEQPTPRRTGILALVVALQASTLAGEIVVQTAFLSLLLLPRRPERRALAALGAAGASALIVLAPLVLLLVQAVSDTQRGRGLDPALALGERASLPALLEALLPRFLGDVHTFTNVGYWGQPFYPNGYPYLLSLYVGLGALLLATGARSWRLFAIALVGVALSLGAAGPLGPAVELWGRVFRAPVKFALMPTLALALAAAAGLDARRARRSSAIVLLPGAALLAAAAVARLDPAWFGRWLGALVPELALPGTVDVIARLWPGGFATSGALALGAGLGLLAPRTWPLVPALVVADLLIVNGPLNAPAPGSYWELRPAVRALMARARCEEPCRLYSVLGPERRLLHWAPELVRRNDDTPLFRLDRQALVPRTALLDGFESALDEDRTGFAPAGAALPSRAFGGAELEALLPLLRWANVRYLLSFEDLPGDAVVARGEARLPEVQEPLRLFELRGPLPRAFFMADAPGGPAGTEASVAYEAVDPHGVRLRATTPPGRLVVLDGYDPRWRAECGGRPVPVERVGPRYRAIRTPGGRIDCEMRFEPPGLGLALASSGLGLLLVSGLLIGKALTPLQARR